MFVSCVCCVLCRLRPLRRAGHSSRGDLPAVCGIETLKMMGRRSDVGCYATEKNNEFYQNKLTCSRAKSP
jgi:hypothetical protein